MKKGNIKILVVDDDPNFKLFLFRTLKEWGHEVITASDGLEALNILKKESIGLVISDWIMPEMDGIKLCETIRNWNKEDYTYFILVTAKSDKPDLIIGRGAGADDYLEKTFETDELEVCLRTGFRILDLQNSLKERNNELKKANEGLKKNYKIIEEDLSAAAIMQKRLLPSAGNIGKLNFQWIFKPAGFVAGDIFNYFPLDEDNIAFYMIDVSGHGVPAALLSVTLQQIISPFSRQGSLLFPEQSGNLKEAFFNPPKVLNTLNQRFQMNTEDQQFFTMLYGVVNQKEKTFKFSLAGHPLPIVQSYIEKDIIGKGSTPIGWIPDVEYEEYEIILNHGDRIFIYSDGLTDCLLAGNNNLLPISLDSMIENSRNMPLVNLMEVLLKRTSELEKYGKIEDDISFLGLEID